VKSRRPSRRKSAPTIEIEGRDRRDRGDAADRGQRLEVAGIERHGPDARRDLVAGNHVGQPGGRALTGRLGRPAERDDHRQADDEGTEGERRAAAVAGQGAAGESLLEAQDRGQRDPDEAPERRQEERGGERGDQERRVHGQRPVGTHGSGRPRPGDQAEDRHRGERRRQPPDASAPHGGHVEPRAERLDRRDPGGPDRGLDRGHGRDQQAGKEGKRQAPGVRGLDVGREPGQGAHGAGHRGPEQGADREAGEGPDRAQHERAEQHEPDDLAPGGPGGSQQADLAGALPDRHRDRVDDEEGAHEQHDRGHERARGAEVRRGRAQPRGEVRGRGQHVGLGGQPVGEPPGDVGRGDAGGEADVDPGDPVEPEGRPRDLERDDHRPPGGARDRTRSGDDPDDPQGGRLTDALDDDLAAQPIAIRVGQGPGDDRRRFVDPGEVGACLELERVELGVRARIDPDDGDRGGRGPPGDRCQVRSSFDRGGHDLDPVRLADRLHGGVGQAGIEEGRHAQVGIPDDIVDRPVDRRVEPGGQSERGGEDPDPERHPDGGQHGPERTGGERAPGEPVEAHRATGRAGRAG
jgi:hypothetical protein